MSDIPYKELYKKMYLVRSFENRLLDLFSQGKLNGTTHTYSGQEAIAASVISNLTKDDIVFSNHKWDTAAAHAIVNESDGLFNKYIDNGARQQHVYNKKNLLNDWFVVKSGR